MPAPKHTVRVVRRRKKKRSARLYVHIAVLIAIPVMVAGLYIAATTKPQLSETVVHTEIPSVTANGSDELLATPVATSSDPAPEVTTPVTPPVVKEPPVAVPKPTTPPVKEEPAPVVKPPVIEAPVQGLDYGVGMSVGETLTILSQSELDRQLDDMVTLGVGWIRIDIAWSSVQPNNVNEFYWEKTDRIVAAANKRNIRVLPILTYTPKWARSSACRYTNRCAPDKPEEYGAFARAAVKRYAPLGITTWEIWNEPNLALFWKPSADPEYYVRLLNAAYKEIHAVDADAIVVTGGLAPTNTRGNSIAPREYLEGIYTYGGKDYFDAVGFHPYTFPLTPSEYHKTSAWSHMNETSWSLRGIMKENGDTAKKIWLTEFGAPTGGPGSIAKGPGTYVWNIPDHVTEEYQAEILEASIDEIRSHAWDGPLFWYSYKDLGTNTSTKENFFGLLRYDGTEKPAYSTMKKILTGGE